MIYLATFPDDNSKEWFVKIFTDELIVLFQNGELQVIGRDPLLSLICFMFPAKQACQHSAMASFVFSFLFCFLWLCFALQVLVQGCKRNRPRSTWKQNLQPLPSSVQLL
jgi:hypothetical protein